LASEHNGVKIAAAPQLRSIMRVKNFFIKTKKLKKCFYLIL
jgi:hypothetical protein